MFNSYYIGGNTTNNKCVVSLNTPSTGFIQKSNPVSRFIRFQRGSDIERSLFPTDPRKNPALTYKEKHKNECSSYYPLHDYYEVEKTKEVTVLQVCIFGDDYMLAEYIFNDDLKEESSL